MRAGAEEEGGRRRPEPGWRREDDQEAAKEEKFLTISFIKWRRITRMTTVSHNQGQIRFHEEEEKSFGPAVINTVHQPRTPSSALMRTTMFKHLPVTNNSLST